MRVYFPVIMALAAGSSLIAVAEENSAQRLESAQQGMAESSWPKKPDNRLSSLSGKMRETKKISPKISGHDREFRTQQLGAWNKDSRLGSVARWEGGSPCSWVETRWNQNRDWVGADERSEKFQPAGGPTGAGELSYREVEKAPSPDWSSRSSRLGGSADGSVRRYDGKLTRVRAQVWQEEKNARDLGPERQEKFRPEDVEKILSQPVGEFAPRARERSPSASPLVTAGN